MKPELETSHQFFLKAQQALQHGDRQAGRRWAEQAVATAPDSEEAWLILAAIASPRASVRYLDQALKINPHSRRARKGMHWAVERLRHAKPKSPAVGHTQPTRK